jgi:hypothetical protein
MIRALQSMTNSYTKEYGRITSLVPHSKSFYKAVIISEVEKKLATGDKEFRFFFNLEVALHEEHRKVLRKNSKVRKALHSIGSANDVGADPTSLEEIVATAIYCVVSNDPVGIKNLFRGLTNSTRELLKTVLYGKFIQIIGLDKAYQMLGTVDSLSTLIKTLPVPSIDALLKDSTFRNSIRYQQLQRTPDISTAFPMTLLVIVGGLRKNPTLNYFVKKDGKVITNVIGENRRFILKNSISIENGGVLFLKTKSKKGSVLTPVYWSTDHKVVLDLYKGNQNVTISPDGLIFDGVFKGNLPYFIKNPSTTVQIKTREDLQNELSKRSAINTSIGLSSSGVTLFNTTQEVKAYPLVDFVLDSLYRPIGLTVNINGTLKEFKYKVPKYLLNNGLDFRSGFIRTTYLGHDKIRQELIGIKEMWSEHAASCNICGRVTYKHYKAGVCSACVHSLKKIILMDNRDCIKFSGNFSGSCTFDYRNYSIAVSSADKEITINKVEGVPAGYQLRLPFVEELAEAKTTLRVECTKTCP